MPRSPRVDYPGAHHHVMNRGAHHKTIFRTATERRFFLRLLREVEDRHQVEVRAYALMPNHFHLLLICREAALSAAMQDLQGRFAGEVHRRSSTRDGPMFRGRFRNRVVEDARYWRHLFAYLHLNPARGGHPSRTAHPLWTSHTSLAKGAEWLHTDQSLDALGGLQAYLDYLEAVRSLGHQPPGFDSENLWGPERWDLERAVAELGARGFSPRDTARVLGVPWARVATRPGALARQPR